MKVARRARYAQKRRWKPSLIEVIAKTIRKNRPAIVANITRNNALFRMLIGE